MLRIIKQFLFKKQMDFLELFQTKIEVSPVFKIYYTCRKYGRRKEPGRNILRRSTFELVNSNVNDQ